MVAILDQYGKEYVSPKQAAAKADVQSMRDKIHAMIRARYDAAQTTNGNQNHWARADSYDPHGSAAPEIRRKLRMRSRYEVQENNPYLKGVILSLANDFVGRGPRLCITDRRSSKERRRFIERRFHAWGKKIKLRRKLWRMRLAKVSDGEKFAFAIRNRRLKFPLQLDYRLYEADQIASPYDGQLKEGEVDGVRYDRNGEPTHYHLLKQHPGNSLPFSFASQFDGDWVDAKNVLHWFRQDRGWYRGIPETAPSLPQCAILRRYTLAVLRSAEFAADIAGVLETDGPPNAQFWQDLESVGAAVGGDIFPTEAGMFVTSPWGYKLKQFDAKQPLAHYDVFVDSILREIVRPLLTPFNLAAGSSQDSNMAASIVDIHTYKQAVGQERMHSEEEVLDPMFDEWWYQGVRTNDFLNETVFTRDGRSLDSDFDNAILESPSLRHEAPEHEWKWDRVGIDHTDPLKVANSIKVLQKEGIATHRDIQEGYFNRDVDDWREERREDEEFNQEIAPEPVAVPEVDDDE